MTKRIPRDPETGQTLRRDVRSYVIDAGGHVVSVLIPGFYGDDADDGGIISHHDSQLLDNIQRLLEAHHTTG